MKYRPPGFKNPWGNPDVTVEFDKNFMAIRTADGTTSERVFAEDRRDIYEAGADAMLEGLKTESDKQKTAWSLIGEMMGNAMANQRNPKGSWVFIPDDTEEVCQVD